MTLVPLLSAPLIIKIHAVAALGAVGLGAAQMALAKGGLRHRLVGHSWMLAMAVTALSSFFVSTTRQVGPFSPIHVLSVITLIALPQAILAARRGDIARHRRIMLILVLGALVGAGLFTLLPGRIMHQVVWG